MSKRRQRVSRKTVPSAPNSQPRWLVPAILVGLGLVLSAIALLLLRDGQSQPFTPEITGKPKAVLDQTYFDYGDVRFNTPVETVIRVKNVGDEPLNILGEPQVQVVEGC
jgi:hypothetical protein